MEYFIPFLIVAFALAIAVTSHIMDTNTLLHMRTAKKQWDVSDITPEVISPTTLDYDGKVVVLKGILAPKSIRYHEETMTFMRDLLAKGRTELTRITETADDTCQAAVHIVGVGDLSAKMLKAGLARAGLLSTNKQIEAETYAKTRKLGIWADNDPLPETQNDVKNKIMDELDAKFGKWASFGELAIRDAQIFRLKRTIEEIDQLALEGRSEDIHDLIDGLPDIDLDEEIEYMSQHHAA